MSGIDESLEVVATGTSATTNDINIKGTMEYYYTIITKN